MLSQPPSTRQFADPTIILAHFIRQIESQHVLTPTQNPRMLHFDKDAGGMVEYPWPVNPKTDQRVLPCQWEAHRRTHEFRAPNCLCSFIEDEEYTETEIGIVQAGARDDNGHDNFFIKGEYVAICAKRRCGYFLCIERFWPMENIQEEEHRQRRKPLGLGDLLHPSDINKSYRKDGLFQMLPSVVLRGRGRGLRSADPEEAKAAREKTVADLMSGVPETAFWKTFVQCTMCRNVQFQEHFELNHRCPPTAGVTRVPGDSRLLRRHHPYTSETPSRAPSQLRASFHARMSALIGDAPALRRLHGYSGRGGDCFDLGDNGAEGDEDSSDGALTELSDAYTTATASASSDGDMPPLFGFGGLLGCPEAPGSPGTVEAQDAYWTTDAIGGTLGDVVLQGEVSAEDDDGVESPIFAGDDSAAAASPRVDGGEVSAYDGALYASEPGDERSDALLEIPSSDGLGKPAARTSDMERWPSVYDDMSQAIARINGPHP